jgi:uncharacterized protein (TIGR03435 family)
MKLRVSKVTLLLLAALSADGQTTPPKPEATPRFEFDVASIKLAPPPGQGRIRIGNTGGPGSPDPGLFSCTNCTMPMLLISAFDLKGYQFPGSVDGPGMDRFNVTARVPEGTTKEQFRLMQQALLMDRFGLKYHWEKKEMQTYELVVAKGGIKMKESVENPAGADKAPAPPAPGFQKLEMGSDGFPILPPGRSMMIMTPRGARKQAVAETMDQLVGILSMQLKKPVTDGTGLKGKYDYILSWTPEGMMMMGARGGGPPPPPPPGGAAPGAGGGPLGDLSDGDSSGPTLMGALQSQLGLKLEQKKGMVDIFVIDHVEKVPTEN